MGWKSLKEHYRIGHQVQVTEVGICIGSSFVHNIITIHTDGRGPLVESNYDIRNADLERYVSDFVADIDLLKALIHQQDVFERSLPVWTYEGGDIIEKQCEEYGYPNVTHDGRMMYNNMFSKDRAEVMTWAIENAEAGLSHTSDMIEQYMRELSKIVDRQNQFGANLMKLRLEKRNGQP